MSRQSAARDTVAITGSVIGLGSVLLGWLTLKPNRLAAGTNLGLWESFGGYGTVILLSWLACLIISLIGKQRSHAILLGIVANTGIITALILTGMASDRLVTGTPFARASLSAGFWATAAGAYMVIFAARQRLSSALCKNLVTWPGLLALVFLLITGWLDHLSILQEFMGRRERFWQELGNHIGLFGGSVILVSYLWW